ncbi:hypothetical protein C8255_02085 [filamentous cyanobacterium CCP3]|nr:hypothetical protein C8255_02085 [filamentous cyanobacterium CCP3]
MLDRSEAMGAGPSATRAAIELTVLFSGQLCRVVKAYAKTDCGGNGLIGDLQRLCSVSRADSHRWVIQG